MDYEYQHTHKKTNERTKQRMKKKTVNIPNQKGDSFVNKEHTRGWNLHRQAHDKITTTNKTNNQEREEEKRKNER